MTITGPQFVDGGRVTSDPTGVQGDAYPENATPEEYKVGALYNQKDPEGVLRAYEENKEEIRDRLRAPIPRLTVDASRMQGGNFTVQDLKECMPNLPDARAREYFPVLRDKMAKWKINSFERVAEFLGVIAHESADLYYWKEIDGERAWYAPWYGRGPIQLTHRENYVRMRDAIGVDIVSNPDLLYRPEVGLDAACAFFSGVNPQRRDLRVEADWGNFDLIMYTVLGAVEHPSYADRWNRYIRASRSLPILFSLTGNGANNFERFLKWIWPLVGKMPYGWWTHGIVPDDQPAYAVDAPLPKRDSFLPKTIFCVGPVNLARRHAKKVIPTAGDTRHDGGTVACWAYWQKFMRTFNIRKNMPHGTLIFRRFRNNADQGHCAIVLGNWRVLQSFDGGEPMKGTLDGPGLNARYTVNASHGGWYYEYYVLPPDWINHNKSGAPWAR